MWHRVDFIAKTSDLDVESFVEYCRQDDIIEKFKLLDGDMPTCSTWHCEALVNSFLVKDQFQPGTLVRSYDFAFSDDCFVEGTVINLDVNNRVYDIVVERQVFNGEELEGTKLIGQIVHPPFNGVDGVFGKTNRVKICERQMGLVEKMKATLFSLARI